MRAVERPLSRLWIAAAARVGQASHSRPSSRPGIYARLGPEPLDRRSDGLRCDECLLRDSNRSLQGALLVSGIWQCPDEGGPPQLGDRHIIGSYARLERVTYPSNPSYGFLP